MILALLIGGLGTVYGLGSLCFIWWDGGSARRTIILLCAIAIALAAWYIVDTDRIPRPHGFVTRGA